MRRMIGVICLTAIGLLFAACASSATGPKVEPGASVGSYGGGPRLALGQRSIDHGKVQFSQQVKASFDVKNVGDSPLTIRKVDVETIDGC